MADFPTTPLPSYPIEETEITPEVLISMHRDGTEQRRLKGSGKKRVFKLQFGSDCPVTNAERLAIVNHFSGQSGTLNSFAWTHPDRGEALTVRYNAAPQFRNSGYGLYSGSVDLQEVPS
jgi:phage-related protein